VNRCIVFSLGATLLGTTACTSQTAPESDTQDAVVAAPDSKYDAKPLSPDGKAETKAEPPANPHAKPPGKQIPPPPDVAAPPESAQKTTSGLAYQVLERGEGDARPGPNDAVKVNYTGWTTDGKTFDTNDGNPPRSFPVGQVIPGWTEGLQLMSTGDKTRFWVPEGLAYAGRIGGPKGMLVFDVELVEITKGPETPSDVAAPPSEAKKHASGLSYKVLAKGKNKTHPRSWDKVKIHYSGWTTDGKMIGSSVLQGKPSEFDLSKSPVPGWTEALPLMSPGEKTRFWLPEELAFKGKPRAPEGMIVFDIELLEFEKKPEPPPPPKVPSDVAAPPAKAKKTASGLAYTVLSKGKGKDHPTAASKVTVHYSGWTTDGKMFDSSVTRGAPATFPLGGVIKGWTEGLQLMVVGEKTRFWIPEELAYGGKPGKPQGMLVFDVELLEIK
jgi:FKBP-type peptidyl-prolyl cis-trans isomerase